MERLGRQVFFVFILGLLFYRDIYIHSARDLLSKEVVLQMTELTPLPQMEYLDLSGKLSIQKW